MPTNHEFIPTPLGTLSILHRELRDEIYRYVYNHKHLLTPYPKTSRLKWQSYNETILDLSMLAVSKIIRQEFLVVLHAEGEFIIWEEPFVKEWFPQAWTRNEIPFIRQIQNVEFFTSVYEWSRDFYIANDMDNFTDDNTILKTNAVAISFFHRDRNLEEDLRDQIRQTLGTKNDPNTPVTFLRSPQEPNGFHDCGVTCVIERSELAC